MLLTSGGEASDIQSRCMGIYRKLKGSQYNHRPIWKHETNERYICFLENQWVVSRSVHGKNQAKTAISVFFISYTIFNSYYCTHQVTRVPNIAGNQVINIKYDFETPNSYSPDKVPTGKWMYFDGETWLLDATMNIYSSRD